jgi:hypothetical protein
LEVGVVLVETVVVPEEGHHGFLLFLTPRARLTSSWSQVALRAEQQGTTATTRTAAAMLEARVVQVVLAVRRLLVAARVPVVMVEVERRAPMARFFRADSG